MFRYKTTFKVKDKEDLKIKQAIATAYASSPYLSPKKKIKLIEEIAKKV